MLLKTGESIVVNRDKLQSLLTELFVLKMNSSSLAQGVFAVQSYPELESGSSTAGFSHALLHTVESSVLDTGAEGPREVIYYSLVSRVACGDVVSDELLERQLIQLTCSLIQQIELVRTHLVLSIELEYLRDRFGRLFLASSRRCLSHPLPPYYRGIQECEIILSS